MRYMNALCMQGVLVYQDRIVLLCHLRPLALNNLQAPIKVCRRWNSGIRQSLFGLVGHTISIRLKLSELTATGIHHPKLSHFFEPADALTRSLEKVFID